ncbi:MAG: ABC transporter permease [Rhizobium sp.]
MSFVDPIFWVIVFGGMLRLATPIFLAALGEMITERSGTLNLGIDGIMTAGAFSAVVCAQALGWQAGLLGAALTGALYGLVVAFVVVKAGANQIIAGIAISLVGTGLTSFLFQVWQPSGDTAIFVPLAPNVIVPYLSTIPLIGPVLFKQNLITYGALLILCIAVWLFKYTKLGLVLRAVGDGAAAAEMRGINTDRVRMVAITVGGCLMGLGGAAITLGFLGSYNDGLTNGRGYVALAVVIIGRWSPVGALAGAFLFAFFDSLSLRIQDGISFLPNEAFSILPYAMTLLVLVATARSKIAPRELGK